MDSSGFLSIVAARVTFRLTVTKEQDSSDPRALRVAINGLGSFPAGYTGAAEPRIDPLFLVRYSISLPIRPELNMAKKQAKTLNQLTQGDAALLLGKSAKWLRDRTDLFAATRNANGTYDAPRLVAAFAEYIGQQAAKQARREASAGGDSPELERWRRIRADLAQLEFEKRARILLPLEAVQQWHNVKCELMRRTGERLQQRFGDDAWQLWSDLIDNLGRLADDMFGDGQQANGSDLNDDEIK